MDSERHVPHQTLPPGVKLSRGPVTMKHLVFFPIILLSVFSLYLSYYLTSKHAHFLILMTTVSEERVWLQRHQLASRELTRNGQKLHHKVRGLLEKVRTERKMKTETNAALENQPQNESSEISLEEIDIEDMEMGKTIAVLKQPPTVSSENIPSAEHENFSNDLFSEDMEKLEFTKKNLNMEQWGNRFAVFSSHTPGGTDYNYPFFLPITVRMWRRIGFESIIIIVGSREEWRERPVLNHILSELIVMDAIVVFLNSPAKYSVLLSQVARLAVTQIIPWNGVKDDDVIVVTSDADIWPINKDYFTLQMGTKIVSLRANCCGFFKHNNKSFRMLPIGHLLMSVKTWKEVMTGKLNNAKQIMASLVQEFGPSALNESEKGNAQWFMDQKLVSMRIAQWMDKHGSDQVDLIPGDNWDRVDRAKWELPKDEGDMSYLIDAHVFTHGYRRRKWRRLKALLWLLLRDRADMTELQEYRNQFIRLLNADKNITMTASFSREQTTPADI